MTYLCVIPARGGSKRIPRKNIRNFCGVPMIKRSIDAAIVSNCFSRIIVSTDDLEIADYAVSVGAEVPFLRPDVLSDDFTGTTPVVKHAIQTFLGNGYSFQAVCCLYPAAPFIRSIDIIKGLEAWRQADDDVVVFSATSFASPVQRAFGIDYSGRTFMFNPDEYSKRSQDLQAAFHDAGQFYWSSPGRWMSELPLFSNSIPLLLPRWRAIDIDTHEDWQLAELMFTAVSTLNI